MYKFSNVALFSGVSGIIVIIIIYVFNLVLPQFLLTGLSYHIFVQDL